MRLVYVGTEIILDLNRKVNIQDLESYSSKILIFHTIEECQQTRNTNKQILDDAVRPSYIFSQRHRNGRPIYDGVMLVSRQ